MNARWNPAPGRVQNYRITYVPTAGGKTQTVSHSTDITTFYYYCTLLVLQDPLFVIKTNLWYVSTACLDENPWPLLLIWGKLLFMAP